MAHFEDFADYARGLKRLERFLPTTRSLIIASIWGVAAWYWHTALVLLACGALLIAGQAGDLVGGLLVEGESLRRETSDLRSELKDVRGKKHADPDELEELWGTVQELREKIFDEISRLDTDVSRFDLEVSTKESDVSDLKLEIEELRQHIEHLEDRLP